MDILKWIDYKIPGWNSLSDFEDLISTLNDTPVLHSVREAFMEVNIYTLDLPFLLSRPLPQMTKVGKRISRRSIIICVYSVRCAEVQAP